MSPRLPRRSPEEPVDLSASRRCHVVGVAGPGMSPLAFVLRGLGHRVSGSDIRESPVLDVLRGAGVSVTVGHDGSLVHDADVVTYSTAVPAGNPELVAATNGGIPVRHRSGMLASLCAATDSVGVAGTHGKTTTSALLVHMLVATGLDPTCIIGARVDGMGVGARVGTGPNFVLEADESDGTLDVLPLRHLVVTNVDVDHLDYFGSFGEVQQCFVDAASRTTGKLVLNADDPASAPLREATRTRGDVTTFGVSSAAGTRVSNVRATETGIEFDVSVSGETHVCAMPLRGTHNAMNLAAALSMAVALGADAGEAVRSVRTFGGVERRFTERGEHHGALLVDDYAHLPAEIEAALAAAREHPRRSGRVVAVFQPNRFHRIAAMADAYADCFSAADRIVITDVYASGTERIEGITGELVVDAVRRSHPGADVVWAPEREDVVRAVAGYVRPGDLCVSMGCGDIETFPDDLMRSAT